MTLVFMALDAEPEQCLANMAGLLVLNEFDKILGYIFDIRAKKIYPKLGMVDDLLKDEFKPQSKKVAETFSQYFLFFNSITPFVNLIYYRHVC